MPLNRKDKQAVVIEVAAQIKKCHTIVLAEYRGISANNLTVLRAKAREQNVYLRVLKNTLARRATEGTPFASLAEKMTGPLIYGISEDVIATAKVISDFESSDDNLIIKVGSFDGKIMSKADVKELASIQSREKLLSILLFVMQAPISYFARALVAIKEKKAGFA
ncbi:MAG: 50S ribosomal protein L10 [Burkholderia sp.]|nr:50S ribosomal protein L10 [Burkholderia sp.]